MDEPEGEGVKQLEDYLKSELLELRNEIEENDLVHGIPTKGMSSLHIPKDVEYFRRERRLCLQRTLQVSEVAPLFCQAEMMQREVDTCDSPEYDVKSLLLIVHQYFLDRMHSLAICKHTQLLRWKRFSVHSNIIESIYSDYKEYVQHLMDEYHDCSSRAQRLSAVKEGFMLDNDKGLEEINAEDITIYMRWLVGHLYSLRLFLQVSRMIEWFPVAHKYDITPDIKNYKEKSSNPSFNRPGYSGTSGPDVSIARSISKTSSVGSTSSTEASVPMPPAMISANIAGSNPLSPTAFNFGMAAAGGGIATDEKSLTLPLHFNDLKLLRPHLAILCNVYSINFDVDVIRTSADEMELYANINRKFRHIFMHQQVMKTHRIYDRTQESGDKWGLDSCNHAMLKDANWLDFVTIVPKKHLQTVKDFTRLRVKNNIDELLRLSAGFIKLQDPDKVQDALRHHALLIQNPPVVHASAVVNHRNGQPTDDVWKKIYANPELYSDSNSGGNFGDDAPGVSSNKMHRRRNSYDFESTMAMLGLEETDKNQDDPSSVQGAYLSFLHLRHLKIRDVQRSCISYLNYFRSVQRTLTINDVGLSLDGGPLDRSPQNLRVGTEYAGHQGGGGTIGAHGYLFNTPREYKINELEFMQYAEIENHDDFFFHEEGRIHVRDQVGYYIIYDVAMKDYEELENDLLYLATHFIQQDKEMRNMTIFKRKRQRNEDMDAEGDFDIAQYAHKELDRFGILYDLWCSECAYQECKADLLDIYLECYQNVLDRDERHRLAQIITNLSFQRPRIDFKDKYFLMSYRLECSILRLRRDFLKRFLDQQTERQREFIDRVWNNPTKPVSSAADTFGLPFRYIPKCPISVHSDESALRNMYMIEFHPSMTLACRVGDIIERSYLELLNIHQPGSVLEEIMLEKRFHEVLLLQFEEMDPMGASYSSNTQRDLFNGMFMDDPNNVTKVARQILDDLDSARQRGDKKARQKAVVSEMGRVIDLVTIRHRLIDAAWETEVLSKVYRHISLEMGYDEFHLYMRYIQFESAKKKGGVESARPPTYITAILEDDALVDKYIPSQLPLAISEMDETHLGRFSFRDFEFVIQLMRNSGELNLRSVLKLQLTQRNGLVSAVLLAHNCLRDFDVAREVRGDSISAPEKSEKSTLTGMSALSRNSVSLASPLMPNKPTVSRYDPAAYFSLQLEKSPSRDRMMNDFISRTSTNSVILKNMNELAKLKRSLVTQFCQDFGERIYQASLRAQLIAYYNSIIQALSKMPNLAKHYFVFGEQDDNKPEDNQTIHHDPRVLKDRPRYLLSQDGTMFLNLWFIPHYSEVLMLFRNLDDQTCTEALRKSLAIIGAFHDILLYLFAHARLGTSSARLGTGAMKEFVTTDWGGTEGLGTVLREIQIQIDHLSNPCNPREVADLLRIRRQTMFLEFDVCVRHVLRETFLGSGNIQAFRSVTDNMHFPLTELSDAQEASFYAVELPVPEPLEPRDRTAKILFPWRSFINSSGLFSILYPPWHRIEYNLQLCLAGLKDVDRPVVHGELLALNLSLEEVLKHGNLSESVAGDTISFNDFRDYSDIVLLGKRMTTERGKSSRPASRQEEMDVAHLLDSASLNTITAPMQSYALVIRFLILWKRLDALKYDWGRRRLGVEKIDTISKYRNFCKLYKSERLYHVIRSLAMQYGQSVLYEHGPLADTDMYVTPSNVPEMVVKQRQLARLVEVLECTFIQDVRRRIARQLDLVLKERNREEGNLPTDLWKRPAMKESFSVRRATIAEDFIQELMTSAEESESSVSFSLDHLNRCLHNLASNVMSSQKEIYENYSMYYENLLRHHHQLLYEREREVLEVKEMLKAREMSTTVDVQFQLADQAHSLILEVTALRAKVAEMREQSLTMESNVREAVRQEYNDMVHNLFAVAFEQKGRIDEYRQHLHTSTLARIAEVRSEAALEMGKVKEKSGAKPSAEDELSKRNLRLSQRMAKVEQYNIHLHQLMSRMKSMFTWRQSHARCDYMRSVAKLQKEKNGNQIQKTRLEMLSTEKFHLLMEELNQVKEYLTNTEKELNHLRRKLDKELREKQEKQHASERKAASDKQLANVKQMHIDKLMDEIQEKDRILREMRSDLDQNLKTQQSTVDKTYKEVDSLKKMLREERKLKQNAFHKVDDLLSQVYEYETAVTLSRGAGASSGHSRPASTSRISRSSSRPSTAIWPPTVSHPPKSLTPELRVVQHDTRVRPKTVSGQRLRSRIAEQLLYNIEPDHHETLVRLERQQQQQQQAQKKEEQQV